MHILCTARSMKSVVTPGCAVHKDPLKKSKEYHLHLNGPSIAATHLHECACILQDLGCKLACSSHLHEPLTELQQPL